MCDAYLCRQPLIVQALPHRREILGQAAKDSIVNVSSASKRMAAEADFGNFDFNEEVDVREAAGDE